MLLFFSSDFENDWIQPKPQFTHLRDDNASSSAAPVYFAQCYLMLKATRNGFELCIFPHITLHPWKQLWQRAMANHNRKLNYSNDSDSGPVPPPHTHTHTLYWQNNSATPGFHRAPTEKKAQHSEPQSKALLTNQWTSQPREFTCWKTVV